MGVERRSDAKVGSALTTAEASPWFAEVVVYRNFAHESFHIIQGLVPKGSTKAIAFSLEPTARGGQQRFFHHLEDYLKQAKLLVQQAYA
jgi:hypothetical protein